MQAVLIETMCLPPVSVMRTVVRHPLLMIEACEHYQKRSYRNRIYINGPQGKLLTSIPLLKGKNAKMPIQEVRISNHVPWSTILLKQIKSNYGSAPYFDFLYDEITIILGQKWGYLWDLNMALLRFVLRHLGQEMEIQLTSEYHSDYPDPISDLRDRYKPTTSQDIRHSSMIEYQQVFIHTNGFVSGLSILDLLMCCGPESLLILKKKT